MPLIQICRDPRLISDQEIKRITAGLAEIVAKALDVPELPEGRLSAKDIEILVRDQHYLNVSSTPLCIIIHANDYPERRANLDERREKIIEGIKSLRKIPSTHGFVWLQLLPGSFGEF